MNDVYRELLESSARLKALNELLEMKQQIRKTAERIAREKTLSEASYEELAKEMWKRCAENTSLV